MTNEGSLREINLRHAVVEQLRFHGWTWTVAGAVLGICGGIIAPLFGSVLTVISWFTGPQWHGLAVQRYGTVMLFLTFPLLILGAHCLDLIDKQDQEAKTRCLDEPNGISNVRKE